MARGGELAIKVGIVGVGTMGSMAMWRLAQRGANVVGFEQFGAGHDRGAAGGESRLFRTAYLEGAQYVPLLRAAWEGWRELERETGVELLTRTGGLTIGRVDTPAAAGVLASIKEFGLEHEVLDAETARARYPQHRLSADEAMILDEQAGFIRPEIAVGAAIRRAEALGAEFVRGVRVDSVEPTSRGAAIRAGGRTHEVDVALVTAGPWAAEILEPLQDRLTVKRLVLTWFPAKDVAAFAPARFPIFTRQWNGADVYGAPSVDGHMVKVTLHGAYGTVDDPDSMDRDVSPEQLGEISRAVAELLPDLVPEPVRISAYMDAFTDDGHAIIGRPNEAPGVLALSGFSGHGFKLAPVVGEVAADLASGKEPDYDVGHLRADRFETA